MFVNFYRLFDILNTRNFAGAWYKTPLTVANKERWLNHLDKSERMCRGIRSANGRLMVETQRKTGFLGMIVNIHSLRYIAQHYMCSKEPKLK